MNNSMIKAGVGKYGADKLWTMATFSDDLKHGFYYTIDYDGFMSQVDIEEQSECRDDEKHGFRTDWNTST